MAICAAQASHRSPFEGKLRCHCSGLKKFCVTPADDSAYESVYECAYESAYNSAYESAYNSASAHQPRILKVGRAGRGCRPARVFSSMSLTPTTQTTPTRIPKVGRAVKRCRPALVFSNISSHSYIINFTRHSIPGNFTEKVTTSPTRRRHVAYTSPTRRLHVAYTSPTQGKATFCKEKRSDYSLMTLGPSLTRTEQCQT